MSKVCVLSQRVPYPPNKGEKLRTYHQIEFLNRLGYEVEVFSLIETAEDKKNAEALAKHLGISVNSYQLGSKFCLLYTSPSPRDRQKSRMPSSA